jgi:hypothetical protein
LENKIEELRKEVEIKKEKALNTAEVRRELQNWEHIYDQADLDEKKIMISKLVRRVSLLKDEIKIETSLDLDFILQEDIPTDGR